MDRSPRRPTRNDRTKAIYFNPEVSVRIVTSFHHRAKISDLWVSREDLRQKREEFHGMLDCLTLDPSIYEEGGYVLLGLDSKKDQNLKYRNMLDSRFAVFKEQQNQNANARWHCGFGCNSEQLIYETYKLHTTDASKLARYTAMRLEEELLSQDDEKPDVEIMSLYEVRTLFEESIRRANNNSLIYRASSYSISSLSSSSDDEDIFGDASQDEELSQHVL